MFSPLKVYESPLLKYLVLIVLFYVFFLPGLGTSFISINEPDWIERSSRFIDSFLRGDFLGTYQKYHPGVTLMWVVGLCIKVFGRFQELVYGYRGDEFETSVFPQFAAFTRFVLGSLFLVLILLSIRKLRKAFSLDWAVFTVAAVLFTEPFVMGLVRSIGPDALLTAFIFAFLCFFCAYLKGNKKMDLVVSGIFLGLSVLTKITALVAFPAIVAGFIVYQKKSLIKYSIIIIAVASLIFFALFPAIWINPVGILKDMLTLGAIDAPLYDYASPIISDIFARNLFVEKIFSYPFVFAFRASPLLLIFFVLGIFAVLSKRSPGKLKIFGVISLLFLICYYIPISFAEKKIYKYTLPMFLPAALVGYIGLDFVLKTYGSRNVLKFFITGVFLVQIIYNLSFVPNYLFYFNPLLGGIKTAKSFVEIDLETTGYNDVGKYLNNLGVGDKKIIATYPPRSLGPFVNCRVEDIRLYRGADFLLIPVGKMEEFKDKVTPCYILEKTFNFRNLDYLYLYMNKCI